MADVASVDEHDRVGHELVFAYEHAIPEPGPVLVSERGQQLSRSAAFGERDAFLRQTEGLLEQAGVDDVDRLGHEKSMGACGRGAKLRAHESIISRRLRATRALTTNGGIVYDVIMAKDTLAVRLEEENAARLEQIARVLSKRAAGLPVSKSEAIRLTIERGLAALEEELRITTDEESVLFARAEKLWQAHCEDHDIARAVPVEFLSGIEGARFVLRNGEGELARFALKHGKLQPKVLRPKLAR